MVLDQGRVADTGTHEELSERSPLYRQLITGPEAGPDAAVLVRTRAGHTVEDAFDGRGTLAGLAPAGTQGLARLGGAGGRGSAGRGRGGGAGVGGANVSGTFASLPPSPRLLAQVEALPPARDVPDVDLGRARAADRHFTLRRLLRPLMFALIAGLVLDGLDALAGIALPALVRNGIDHGVETKVFHAIVVVSLIALAIVLADWLVNVAETMVVGRNGERLLFTLRVKIFAQLQRLGLDYYEREMSGRIMTRMTTDVDALSTFLQTGLITMVSSVLTFFGVLAALLIINLRLGLYILGIFPVLLAATVVFRSKSAKAYGEAREKVAAVNADFAENVAGLRVTQAFRREQANRARFGRLSDAFRVTRLRTQRYIAVYFPFVQTLFDGSGRDRPGRRDRPGAQRHAGGGRADRLPALHRHGLLPRPAALPGLRRLPAGHGRPAPDHGAAQAGHVHPRAQPAGCRGPAARPHRAARRGLRLHGQRGQRDRTGST